MEYVSNLVSSTASSATNSVINFADNFTSVNKATAFLMTKIPLYGASVEFGNKTKTTKEKMTFLKKIRADLQDTLNENCVYSGGKAYPLKAATKQELTNQVNMIDQKIDKLKEKI